MALPLAPLALAGDLGNERFFFAAWAALALLLVASVASLHGGGRGWRALGWLALAAVAAGAGLRADAAMRRLAPELASYRLQGQAILDARADDVVWITEELLPHFALGLRDIRRRTAADGAAPTLVSDEIEWAGLDLAGRRLLRLDAGAGRMVDLAPQAPQRLAAWRARLRDAPLSVEFAYDRAQRVLSGHIDSGGPARIFHIGGGARTEAPPRFAIRAERASSAPFRIRVDAADGGTRYTPPLVLDGPADAPRIELRWSGAGCLQPETAACTSGRP